MMDNIFEPLKDSLERYAAIKAKLDSDVLTFKLATLGNKKVKITYKNGTCDTFDRSLNISGYKKLLVERIGSTTTEVALGLIESICIVDEDNTNDNDIHT